MLFFGIDPAAPQGPGFAGRYAQKAIHSVALWGPLFPWWLGPLGRLSNDRFRPACGFMAGGCSRPAVCGCRRNNRGNRRGGVAAQSSLLKFISRSKAYLDTKSLPRALGKRLAATGHGVGIRATSRDWAICCSKRTVGWTPFAAFRKKTVFSHFGKQCDLEIGEAVVRRLLAPSSGPRDRLHGSRPRPAGVRP